MSIRSIKARMHEAVDALPDEVRFSPLSTDIAVMKAFLQSVYSELQTYAFHCGAENDSIQNEAVDACDVIDSAFVKQLHEREFESRPNPGYTQQVHGTYNALQQFVSSVEGARL
ncbi:hypothetical protein CDO22_17900 [Sinorhizobium meliloti]|uniref:hypothetical protein n=1 Tax=Rhizobium meliloti TaxID=382 RepID=UPI000B49F446|nr:hypothetical protein [Sinorhizobium meliloti]ASQ10199.1 hypothetical protein CDO22_08505 [Sinorhizobium meliloti]ASQ11867.1 hypothetical protein CDO22_17900 [Sinorhizobium meliloti]MQU82958.1 hypothetical protein [Sinorhizobium meliloti]MQU83340.1 hypothetical protein [Sinorhizobium meliloti]MQU83636.1 hypothetical protein [Sinorhizobium meliloti]